eukprot:1192699-Prorocentrum_minimum.AAC.1
MKASHLKTIVSHTRQLCPAAWLRRAPRLDSAAIRSYRLRARRPYATESVRSGYPGDDWLRGGQRHQPRFLNGFQTDNVPRRRTCRHILTMDQSDARCAGERSRVSRKHLGRRFFLSETHRRRKR